MRARSMNNKGFSFVEILAVFVLLGIIAVIGIGAVARYTKQQRYKNYDALITSATSAADEYIMDNPNDEKFTFDDLVNGQYLDTITDPMDKTKDCRGKIKVRKSVGGKSEDGKRKKLDNYYYTINYCCQEFNRTYDSKTKVITEDEKCKADPYDLNDVPLIRVLNVYPTTGADKLKTWMQHYGKHPDTGEKKIEVTPVLLDNFNSNPSAYLKKVDGKWNYEEVVFGFWDCNASKDLSALAASTISNYLQTGGSAIFGHDTITANGCGNHSNFNSLASFVNMDLRSGVPFKSSNKVKIAHKGIFTEFPWNIGNKGTILTIPTSHVYGQVANGDVWITFEGLDDIEANKIYLSTYGNNAFIQTGHSSGSATDDEQKILANIIFYVVGKQYAEADD